MSGSYLTFGSLQLDGISADGLYELRVLGAAHGTNITSGPAAITATMQSFVQDGAIVATTGHENRTLPIAVQVTDGPLADPGEGVPIGADALVEQCRATWDGTVLPLRWVPSDGLGPPCVFEVTAADLGEADFNGAMEVDPSNLGTIYLLSLTCNPWSFADGTVTETIEAANTTTPVVTEINDCSSTAGWSGPATVETGADATYGSWVGSSGEDLVLSGLSVDMSSTPYLVIQTNASHPVLYNTIADVRTPLASWGNRFWFAAGSATLSRIQIQASRAGSVPFRIYDVSRSDRLPNIGNQATRQFEVQGSVRTPATIGVRGVNVQGQTDAAIGQTLVYTTRSSNAATPNLRQFLQAGPAQTADATAYSGFFSSLSTPHIFLLDAGSVASAGYDVVARLKAANTVPATVTWTVQTLVNDVPVDAAMTGTVTLTPTVANAWQMFDLAHLPLPLTQTGSAGQVRISLSSLMFTVDEVWLCDIDNGRLTWGDFTASTRLWIKPASFDSPMYSVWAGSAADGSDSYVPGPAVASSQQHDVQPPTVNVFVAAANPPEVSLTYTPAGHTRAPRVKAS